MRIGVFGAPVSRPLDFAEAFLGGDFGASRSDCEEHGAWRVFVIECAWQGRPLALTVSIAPRRGAADAFTHVLKESDAGILLVGAGGWREQEPALQAFDEARLAAPNVPLVHVVNEFVPPRLEIDPTAEEAAERLRATRVLRGRLCWWRHEKAGTDLARAAVEQAMLAAAGSA